MRCRTSFRNNEIPDGTNPHSTSRKRKSSNRNRPIRNGIQSNKIEKHHPHLYTTRKTSTLATHPCFFRSFFRFYSRKKSVLSCFCLKNYPEIMPIGLYRELKNNRLWLFHTGWEGSGEKYLPPHYSFNTFFITSPFTV